MIDELPEDLIGTAVTPSTGTLFNIEDDTQPLEGKQVDDFHHYVAKILYLSKRARPDLQTTVSFLCTRVQSPTVHDWLKLKRLLKYIQATKDLPLIIEDDGNGVVYWHIDGSFAVHHDMKSHTGIFMSTGKGALYASSRKQKINTKSSTEAEVVAVDDGLNQILWTKYFLEAQGYDLHSSTLYQDNQAAILLEQNGKASSTKRTKHINIRYFFITDVVKDRKEVDIEYLPTDQMIGDYYTKPLTGGLFHRMRNQILNIRDEDRSLYKKAYDAYINNKNMEKEKLTRGASAA